MTNKKPKEEKKEDDKSIDSRKYDFQNKDDILDFIITNRNNNQLDKLVWDKLAEFLCLKSEVLSINNNDIIIIFDENTSLDKYDSDQVYSLLSEKWTNDVLLVLNHNWWEIEPAYFISKTCQKKSKNLFKVVVPRKAKSAATLISLWADEIHMWIMSELWPIDPQVKGLPALWLWNALEYLAKTVTKYPDSSRMFAQYLNWKLELPTLGYFDRIAESSVQYAERLLSKRRIKNKKDISNIANVLTYSYKDHGFVIEIDEVKELLGDDIVKAETNEYKLWNEVYSLLNQIQRIYQFFLKKKIAYVWDLSTGLRTWDIESK